MKTYYIRIFAHEDEPETICGYSHDQFLDVVKSLKQRGLKFSTWTENGLFPNDREKTVKNKGVCPFLTTKKCDGLCNNCPQDVEEGDVIYPNYSNQNKGSFGMSCGDYEELILARQEMLDC